MPYWNKNQATTVSETPKDGVETSVFRQKGWFSQDWTIEKGVTLTLDLSVKPPTGPPFILMKNLR